MVQGEGTVGCGFSPLAHKPESDGVISIVIPNVLQPLCPFSKMLRLSIGNDKWTDEFETQIEELDITDLWTLQVNENNLENGGLKFERETFGSFRCSYCRHHWSSSVIHIRFLITLDRPCKRGIVNMKIAKQSCKMCNCGVMEKPQISDENIKIMIKNLVLKINRTFYEKEKDGRHLRSINYYNEPKGPHDKDHCEDCQEGHSYLEEPWYQDVSHHKETKSQQGLSTALTVAGVTVGLGALALACMAFSNPKNSSKK
uniref:Receptor (chemosensory) transporter protein 3 gene A gene 3 [provisional] n=2 Tax=Xenopus tropicalis TaxID=8364 RepID=A0A803J3Y2_XENTR